LDGGWYLVAGLSICGAKFFLTHESPPHGMRSPDFAGFTMLRIEFFVDDPVAVHRRALSAGASVHSPVEENQRSMTGPHPIQRKLQGAVMDPFSHLWLVGKILE
jgi:uncharacterized glyoxalase superfamily protein PhnB